MLNILLLLEAVVAAHELALVVVLVDLELLQDLLLHLVQPLR
jgi:hypothetical protein